ncbi:MAG: T9SS type A sorting domain-containing protein [Bacteroidota bacterium]
MRYLLLAALGIALTTGVAPTTQAQTPGNCQTGVAQRDLDVNNVRARMYNIGNLFWRATDPVYTVPASGTTNSIFAAGIWVAGLIDGELRVAGSTYGPFEFWPGPLNEDGTLPDPNDCAQFDRLYKVSRSDIIAFESGGATAPDLRDWPAELGAPVLAASNNGFDDDGDGLTDEGTDGLDNDGDGRVDERDEIERADPDVRQAAGRSTYDLAGGDRPDIIGDQGIWWVMNDVGNRHQRTGSPPIGLEIQAQAFAFARADALNDVTFYKYKFVYRGTQPLEEAYLTLFVDADLGNEFEDDYIGSDPELGVGYIYNADNEDVGGYGVPPPALGYDFFQGPIVDEDFPGVGDNMAPDTLGMTSFGYFNNGSCDDLCDPDDAQQYYNYMTGRWKDGQPWTEGSTGRGGTVPVDFVYPNFPGEYWSELCPDSPTSCGDPIPPSDRRFFQTTGPFTINPGDVQDITFGIVWATGSDNIGSVSAMLAADQLAQTAFDVDFELPLPPPPPSVSVSELNGEVVISWSYDESSSNFLGTYEVNDPFLAERDDVTDKTYDFQGFNVYQFDSPEDATPTRIATYDIVDGVTQPIDQALDAATGAFNSFIAAFGSDSGLQYYQTITGLTNYQDFYYGVSAYAFNDSSIPKVLEGQIQRITVRPRDVFAANNGNQVQIGGASESARLAIAPGLSPFALQANAVVVDPFSVDVNATYTVEVVDFFTGVNSTVITSYNVYRGNGGDLSDDTQLFDGIEFVTRTGRAPTAFEVVRDGIAFLTPTLAAAVPAADRSTDDASQPGPPNISGNGAGIVEISSPSGDTCDDNDSGCEVYDGNTVWQDLSTTGSYYLSSGGNTASIGEVAANAAIATPEDYEIRFTQECATEGNCFGAYLSSGNGDIISVPFEFWNLGRTPDDPSDDIQMIPYVRSSGAGTVPNFADTFPGTDTWNPDGVDFSGAPTTERLFVYMPDRPNGYELFNEAARAFGGGGAEYDRDNDGDTQIDLGPLTDVGEDAECRLQGMYTDFCYRGTSRDRGNSLINNLVFADASGSGETPAVGTVIRIITTKPFLTEGDVFEIDGAAVGSTASSEESLAEAVDNIFISPNPYRGESAYEIGGENRVARFINLTERSTIRIFTLAGTLVRTLETNDPEFDWDLNTEAGLPIASGMYLIYVEAKNGAGDVVGEKVIKFGVVQREIQLNNF